MGCLGSSSSDKGGPFLFEWVFFGSGIGFGISFHTFSEQILFSFLSFAT